MPLEILHRAAPCRNVPVTFTLDLTMGIDVALVDERHEKEQEILDPNSYLSALATGEWLRMEESVCLRFIDPYGDAVFNQAQMPHLLVELEQSATKQADPKLRAHLLKICSLVRGALDTVHMYVKFIGD